jgi:hypothetical protein
MRRSAKWILLVVLGIGVLWVVFSPGSEVATPVQAQKTRPRPVCNPPDGGNCCCWGYDPSGFKCGAWTPPVGDAAECHAMFTGGEVPGCGQTDQAQCDFFDQ